MRIEELSIGNFVSTPFGVAVIRDVSTSIVTDYCLVELPNREEKKIKIVDMTDLSGIEITEEWVKKAFDAPNAGERGLVDNRECYAIKVITVLKPDSASARELIDTVFISKNKSCAFYRATYWSIAIFRNNRLCNFRRNIRYIHQLQNLLSIHVNIKISKNTLKQ